MSGRFNPTTIIGVVLITFSIAALISSFQIKPDPDGGWGARIFPLVGSGSLLLLGAIELFKGMKGELASAVEKFNLPAVLGMLALALSYVWVMNRFGYLLSTGVAAPIALWLFGVRSRVGLLVAAIVCPALYHLIFFEGLGVYPPLGRWFDLIDVIRGY